MSKSTKITISLLLVAVLAVSFGAGYELGGRTYSGTGDGLGVVKQAWDIIFTDYVDKDKLDAGAMSRAAIDGMVETLDDPYTSYLDAEGYQMSVTHLEGEFDGIGAYVTITDEQLTVIAPIAGSPAEEAGIRAGDLILEINGVPAKEMSLAEAVLKIRGPRGTSVKLLILHEDETEPQEIEIVRSTVEVPSVRFEMREDIAYINITQFSERTDEELIPVLQSAIANEASGIILDLRSNPGGLLDVVIDIASHFISEGTVVKILSNQEELSTLPVEPGEITVDLPIVVLVDKFSASGSEVLAGALQDYGRATIAGEKTYGKGSVNILRRLADGSGLYITTARWMTPDGRLIEGEGIEPDYELDLDDEDAIQWAMDYLAGIE